MPRSSGASGERAIPRLPALDLDASLGWWQRLGFIVRLRQEAPDGYAILCRGDLEVHLRVVPGIDPATSEHGCYLRVEDADRIAAEVRAAGLDVLAPVGDRPWGMRELALADPAGNLVCIGHPLG